MFTYEKYNQYPSFYLNAQKRIKHTVLSDAFEEKVEEKQNLKTFLFFSC